ncbi:MAG TPA: hypothetical protein VKZ53_03910 [Candidatus Angelobacter sp.]|nr:hypothetical protein [Candidatus Angelobacter sp.]
MRELGSSFWIRVKALLFLVLGLLSGGMILVSHPSLKLGMLLAVTVWSFCRLYYFMFYVIERYLDSGYRFSGLISFFRYCLNMRKGSPDRLKAGSGEYF